MSSQFLGYAILDDMGGFITRPDGSATFEWLDEAKDCVGSLVERRKFHAIDLTIVGLVDLSEEE